MNYECVSLEAASFAEIYSCFRTAFSDYPLSVRATSQPALFRRCEKNGWQPDLSAGVLLDEELVAIMLTGTDFSNGEQRAYDILTGIIPGHRGHGLAGKMLHKILPPLMKQQVSRLFLEVLELNHAAIRAYQKGGFVQTRSLQSMQLGDAMLPESRPTCLLKPISAATLCSLSAHCDFEPSYEQRDTAIRFLENELIMVGAFEDDRCIAAVAHDPASDWLMRLVCNRAYRRRGLATELLIDLKARLEPGKPIKAINIDASDKASLALFNSSTLFWRERPDTSLTL